MKTPVHPPLVYVAGPISSDPFGCVRQAIEAFGQMREMGLVPFLPQLSVLSEMVEHRSYGEWLSYDFDVIAACEALIRLPGESPGADQEEVHAADLGLPVFRWEIAADITKIHEWLAVRTNRFQMGRAW